MDAQSEQALLTCLLLWQKASRNEVFTEKELEDLRYFLGLPKDKHEQK